MRVVYRLTAAGYRAPRAWYETERAARGARFETAVHALTDLIAEHPDAFPVVEGSVRRALVSRFPYALYDQPLDDQTVEVFEQIEDDIAAGKLDALANEALAEHEADRSRKL